MRFFPVYTILLPLLFSACAATPGTSTQAQFTAPILTKAQWEVDTYTSADRTVEFCSVSSGFNGLEVIVRKAAGEVPTAVVRSTRDMSPGSLLLVSVNGHNHNTRNDDGYFSPEDSKALIADMEVGKEAYLYWKYPSSSNQSSADKFANKIAMGGFASYYQECVAGKKVAH